MSSKPVPRAYSRPRDERNWSWASRESIDERLEHKIGFVKNVGPIFTAFGDHDYVFYHDGEKLRCYTDSELNPGWIYEGDEAVSCLRHQLRMDRDYRSEHASLHRTGDTDE